MVKISGDRVVSRLHRMTSPEGPQAINRALFTGGSALAVEAQVSLTTGAVSGKAHVPSRPGEPPNQNTGVLGNNIEAVNVAPLRVEVRSTAPYARHLEYGTSKMAERPYMRPATARTRPKIVELIRKAVDHVNGSR